jgi:hypothetical protein
MSLPGEPVLGVYLAIGVVMLAVFIVAALYWRRRRNRNVR